MADSIPDKPVSFEQCKGFRLACQDNQKGVRSLLEAAIEHSEELAVVQAELKDLHMEKLFTMQSARLEKAEKAIINLHTKINSRFTTILIGAILYLLGVGATFGVIISDVKVNTNSIGEHKKPEMHSEARSEFARVNKELAKCKEHVAQSGILIKKYDEYAPKLEELEDRINEIELFDAKTHK